MNSTFLKNYSLVLILSLFMLSSCTLEKRVYSRGFNIEWLSVKKPFKQQVNNQVTKKPTLKNTVHQPSADSPQVIIDETQIAAKGSTYVKPDKPFFDQVNANLQNDKCDLMILRNGDEINAKVVEISTNQIKYKKCENLDGPDYYIDKKDVFMIKYANGVKETIEDNSSKENNSKLNNKTYRGTHQTTPGIAVVAFVLSLLSLFLSILGFFTLIASLILGIIALNKINKNPELYKGRGLAIAAIVISSVFLFLILLFLVVLILAFSTIYGI